MTDISIRKKAHVELTAQGKASYQKTTGLERYQFRHNPLPELNLAEIDTSKALFGRQFALPLFISSMTGGYAGATAVNEIIAETCEHWNLPFGVGSQRAMLVDSKQTQSFTIVRKKAPHAFIAANLGGVQLIREISFEGVLRCVDAIEANALIIHLNPLQELMQTEGDRDFKGVLQGIERVCASIHVPIIVKETGAGIDFKTAKRLFDVGVSCIDIAGSGGTSWAKVENLRKTVSRFDEEFNEWGISLVDCLETFKGRNRTEFQLIASGGIQSPFDALKCLALGADFVATAQPIIKVIVEQGEDGLNQWLQDWQNAQQKIQLLLGVKHLNELSLQHLLY